MRRLALAVLALAVGVAPALAGGSFMDVAARSQTVWVTGEFGIRQIDARTGRALRTIVPGPLYPLGVAVAGGAAWVASVEQGYTGGRVTRIDVRTAAVRTIFLRQGWAPQQLAVGRGTIWVLFGTRSGFRLGRFDLRGALLGITRLPRDAGWLAADGGSALVCCRERVLLRIDPRGRVRSAFPLPVANPIWVAAGSIWLAGFGVLERIEERTGRVLARIRIERPYDVTSAADSIYALGAHSVVRVDTRTNRVLERRGIPGVTQGLSAAPTGVWVASVSRPARSRLFRLDPRTLAVVLRLELD